jgi:hypothetical protein
MHYMFIMLGILNEMRLIILGRRQRRFERTSQRQESKAIHSLSENTVGLH